MKGHKTLIGLVLVIAVLTGLYFVMGKINENKAENEVEEDIVVINMGDVSFVEYTDGTNTMSFGKGENGWYWTEDEAKELDQTLVQGIADDLAYISAVRKLENADEFADYGLDKPSYTILIKDNEGNEVNVHLGNSTGDNYYATVGDTGVVYTVGSAVADSLEWDVTALEMEEETEETTDETTEE